jgi:hypothetical protein
LPESELNPRRNDFKDDILPSDMGTAPVKMLRFNRRAVTKLSLPNDDGTVPDKLFALRSSNDKLDSPPNDEGMDPVIPRPVSCTAVTMLLLHVTPVQNAVDPLQMDVVGEFDVHDQIEYMEFIFVAATRSHKICHCDADITTVGSVNGLLDG